MVDIFILEKYNLFLPFSNETTGKFYNDAWNRIALIPNPQSFQKILFPIPFTRTIKLPIILESVDDAFAGQAVVADVAVVEGHDDVVVDVEQHDDGGAVDCCCFALQQ